MRTHVVLPESMVREVDELVGKRKRSKFVEEAVREKLRRQALLVALADTAGMVSAEDQPEWATPEKTLAWIRKLRREGDQPVETSRDG